MIELLSRIVLATLAVALFSAAYLQMTLNELPEIALYAPAMMIHEPIFIAPLVVADVALFALVMIAKISQFRLILRCYAYAGIAYAIGIYLISSGHDFAVAAPFYGPLLGWLIAVIQNHCGSKIYSCLRSFARGPSTNNVKSVALLAVLVIASLSHGLRCVADEWGPITKFEFQSENGRFVFRIEPHDDWPDKPGHCRGTLYHVDGDKRTEVWSRHLINNHAPVDVFVSNSGEYLLTMDEWHSVGELPVVIYGKRGGLVRVHSTDSLGLKNDIEHIKQSVSSYWWNEDAISFFGPKDETFFIKLHWGKLVMLNLRDGDLMDDEWYAIVKGWAMPESKWRSLHEYAKRELAKRGDAESTD